MHYFYYAKPQVRVYAAAKIVKELIKLKKVEDIYCSIIFKIIKKIIFQDITNLEESEKYIL